MGGWRNQAASGALIVDGVAAIGFAAALAGGVAAYPAGLAAMAPWLALGGAMAALRGGGALAGAKLGAQASATVRSILRRHAIVACLGRSGMRMPVGEMLTIAVDAVETLDGYVARFLPAQRAASAVSLLVLAATAIASPVSAIILAGTLVPFIVLMILAGGAAADESRQQFAAMGRLSGLFADRIRALPVVLAFQAEGREASRLAVAADDLRRRTMGVLRIAFISSAGLEFFAALSVALVAVYAGFDLLGLLPFPAPERLTLPRALFVLALAPEFYAPMRRVAAAYHDRQLAEAAADQIMALDRAEPDRTITPVRLAAAPHIRFEAVSVRYPGDEALALAELDFQVGPGEIAVLLGPSGAGKTTALRLLLGLAPLAGGEVWVDAMALSELGALSGSVAWMGQNPIIMPGSIADNIALARQDDVAGDAGFAPGGLHRLEKRERIQNGKASDFADGAAAGGFRARAERQPHRTAERVDAFAVTLGADLALIVVGPLLRQLDLDFAFRLGLRLGPQIDHRAEALAGRAPAVRGVEGEKARFQLVEGVVPCPDKKATVL